MIQLPTDVHSYAQPNVARVTHLAWKAQVDFDSKTIRATTTWTIQSESAQEIILDTKGLSIEEVKVDGKKSDFSLGSADAILGQALTIPIEKDTKTIAIRYTTSPEANTRFYLHNHKLYWRVAGCRVRILRASVLPTVQK